MPLALRRLDPVFLGLAVVVCAAGAAAESLPALAVALISLLPVVSHVRWVGLHRAVTEPTPVTAILFFYLAVFPQRALVIVLDDYQHVLFAPFPVTGAQVVRVLLLAALATTVMIEAFHYTTRQSLHARAEAQAEPVGRVTWLMLFLHGVALLSLVGIIHENGGVSGTINTFGGHDTQSFAAAKSFSLSLWATFATPAIWTTALLATRSGAAASTRVAAFALSGVVIAAQLVLFGSRLQVILALVGCWSIWYFAGHRVPAKVVFLGLAALIAVSFPILKAREGGRVSPVPLHDRVSTTIGYSIFDISLAQHQVPGPVRVGWKCPQCWKTLPEFLAPAWPHRPDVTPYRMSTAVVRTFGTVNQQNSGFPASVITEAWVVTGWFGTLVVSAVIGAVAGRLHRRLVGIKLPDGPALLWYALLVTGMFTFYKDGDLYGSTIGLWRNTMYLGLAMIATGLWDPLKYFVGRLDDEASKQKSHA